MPFASEKQRRFMHAKHPEIAEKWEHEKRSKRRKAMKKAMHKMPNGHMMAGKHHPSS